MAQNPQKEKALILHAFSFGVQVNPNPKPGFELMVLEHFEGLVVRGCMPQGHSGPKPETLNPKSYTLSLSSNSHQDSPNPVISKTQDLPGDLGFMGVGF